MTDELSSLFGELVLSKKPEELLIVVSHPPEFKSHRLADQSQLASTIDDLVHQYLDMQGLYRDPPLAGFVIRIEKRQPYLRLVAIVSDGTSHDAVYIYVIGQLQDDTLQKVDRICDTLNNPQTRAKDYWDVMDG